MPIPTRNRHLLAGAAVSAAAGLALSSVTVVAQAEPTSSRGADQNAATSATNNDFAPLRIMLTNDDGYTAPGIVALRDALTGAGHEVTVVAPASNQSGASARAAFGGTLEVSRPDEMTYAVEGSPADSVEVGLSTVFADKEPDLVISGSNAGQNIAAAAIHSGTVGAAVTAMTDGIPAIAVSTEIAPAGAAMPYAETAQFVVKLVSALQKQTPQSGLLSKGHGLNVNYPYVENGRAPKPVLSTIGTGALDLTYDGALPAVGESGLLSVEVDLELEEKVKGADSTALANDQISISVIQADYDAGPGWAAGRSEALMASLDKP